jgi:hypothetical protein
MSERLFDLDAPRRQASAGALHEGPQFDTTLLLRMPSASEERQADSAAACRKYVEMADPHDALVPTAEKMLILGEEEPQRSP